MRPEGRVAAAIGILDEILSGHPAEQVLIRWARGNRFAGSGDRAAIRDLVFDALRCRGSLAARAGADRPSGRVLMTGHALAAGGDPEALFTGAGFGPAVLAPEERAAIATAPVLAPAAAARLDCPAWILPRLEASLGAEAGAVLEAMQRRAPVFLRVNAARGTVAEAVARLAGEAIVARPAEGASFALEVIENAQKIRTSGAYAEGIVELQDLSPQRAVEALPLDGIRSVLDYCAGGGGKALALAARGAHQVTAHDIAPERLADLPARAGRAGARIGISATRDLAGRRFDLVLLDVPCSGTGTWRRTPDAKWRLTPARLSELGALQARILDDGAALAAPGGRLAYMTCSLLDEENSGQIDGFLARHPAWRKAGEMSMTPLSGSDGFYLAHLTRA